MEETGLSEQDTEQMRARIDSKDYLGIEELVKAYSMREDLKELILSLPGLFGSSDVIDKVKKVTVNKRSLDALENLRQVLEILEDYGLSKYVSIDLGMVQSLNYYSGIIFRGFTYGVGFPICSGGRYDNLVEKFGMECPATGFSLGINMIMMAIDRQKINSEKPQTDSFISYGSAGRKTAFQVCEELRKQGLNVEMDITTGDMESAREYAQSKGIGGIIFITDSENIEIHNIETGEITKTSMSELLKAM
jgi:ATP phosphoribosyltransferase regulatory subunit